MLLFKLNLLKNKTVLRRKLMAISSSNYRNGFKPYEEIPRVTFLNFLSVSLRPSKRGKLDKVYYIYICDLMATINTSCFRYWKTGTELKVQS